MLLEFLTRLFPLKANEKRILILGLDAAGKTTFLYRMHLGEIVTTIPTIGFNVETIRTPTSSRRGPLQLTCWDVGGCDKIWPLLRHYTAATDALIWIIDSNDRERLPEALEELKIIINVIESGRKPGADPIPCLILANKQDLPKAMRVDEIRIGLAPVISTRPSCAVFTTSIISDNYLTTVTPAMDWLYDMLAGVEPKQPVSTEPSLQGVEQLAEKLNSWVERASKDIAPNEFLQAFEAINLPSWDHYTHVRIAYTILKVYGRQKGKTIIFDGLERYIKTSTQTTGRTFHVTMTYFWIQVVHFGMQSMPVEGAPAETTGNDDFCRYLLLNPYVVDGNLWTDYYSKNVIMTPNAKENMVLPDKQQLPSLISRDSVRK